MPSERFDAVSRRAALLSLCALVSVFALSSGCSDGGSTVTVANQTLVRSLNAYVPPSGTPNNTGIMITGSGQTITGTDSLGFGQFFQSGSYYGVSSGAFAPQATGTGISTPLTLPTAATLAGNDAAYAVVAAGEAGQTGTLAPQLFLVPNFTEGQIAIPSNASAIRVVNFSVNPNPIGLYATSSSTPSTPISASVASVAYGYSSATNGYVAVPTSQLKNLALVDTTAPQTTLSLSGGSGLNSTSFQSGVAYTLYIFGQSGNSAEPLGATWVVDYPVQ